MFDPQAKFQLLRERLADCKQNFDTKLWHTFIDYDRYGLQSNEANYIYLNVGNSDHYAFPQSMWYHMVFRLKACETVTTGGGAKCSQ